MRRLLAILFMLLATAAHAEIAVPEPDWVVDQAGLLSPGDRQRVEEALRALGAAPHPATMAIVIVEQVPDGDIETYALTVARAWGLGRADANDGLLLVHAVQDRRYRFEVGPGLQDRLNDAAIGDIGRQHLVPELKANRPRAAYLAAIEAISVRLGNPLAGQQEATEPAPLPGPTEIQRMALTVVVALVLGIVLRRHSLLGAAGTTAAAGGAVAALGFPVGAELFKLMLMGGGLAFAVALVTRNLDRILFALANAKGGRGDDRPLDSGSGSSSDSSPAGGGGDFDGGGASGRY